MLSGGVFLFIIGVGDLNLLPSDDLNLYGKFSQKSEIVLFWYDKKAQNKNKTYFHLSHEKHLRKYKVFLLCFIGQ